jgi:hypothetical protein
MRTAVLAVFFVLSGCRKDLEVKCSSGTFTCQSFSRNDRLGHYTCWRGGGNVVQIPISVGDACLINEKG